MPNERQPWASSDDPDGATPLEDEEREGLKPTWIATRSDLNNAEAANIAQALRARRWSRLSASELLDDLCLRQLHLAMFGDVWRWAGSYRPRLKWWMNCKFKGWNALSSIVGVITFVLLCRGVAGPVHRRSRGGAKVAPGS